MLILKILGIIFLVILLSLLLVLLSTVGFKITSKSGEEISFNISFNGFKLKPKDKNQSAKPNTANKKEKKKLPDNVKKLLGIDRFDSIKNLKTNLKETGFDGTFGKTINIVKFLMKQLGKLISRVKLKSLDIVYIHSGEDAADTAVNYGVLCAFVYPFATYIKESTNSKDSKFSVNLNCDFDRKKPYYEFNCEVRLKIIYALIVFLKTVSYITKENKNEER